MADTPEGPPSLDLRKPDDSYFSRIEMEYQIKERWKKMHWLRIQAGKMFNLPRQFCFGMPSAVLRHWFLDEMIRRGHIYGDLIGVNTQSYEDPNEVRQFTQRLSAMIQQGQALIPEKDEGIDMSNTPAPPNGFMPPVPGNGFGPPAPPNFAPQPPAGPPVYSPPMAPPMPQGGPPGVAAPPGAFSPAPQNTQAPEPPAPVATTGRRGRKPATAAQIPADAPPAQQTQMGDNIPMPTRPMMGVMQPVQSPVLPVQSAGPVVDLGSVESKLAQLSKGQDHLSDELKTIQTALAIILRGMYNKPGNTNLAEAIKDALTPQ